MRLGRDGGRRVSVLSRRLNESVSTSKTLCVLGRRRPLDDDVLNLFPSATTRRLSGMI